MSEYRTGMGWDVHRLVAGRPLILGGVRIPSEFGLDGHSDADVLAHAITDALLGAAALGDIGHALSRTPTRAGRAPTACCFSATPATWPPRRGFDLVNVDSTVILERPKLKDYRAADPREAGRGAGARVGSACR